MARYRRAAPKLISLGWRGWTDLAKAQAALLRAQREMRRRPTGDLVHDRAPARSSSAERDRRNEVERLALAVNRAAAFGLFRPKCLVRSMGLRHMIDDAGIEGAIVRVGVQVQGGRFIAHAWVEYDGKVVGDDPNVVGRFLPLSGIQVAEFE